MNPDFSTVTKKSLTRKQKLLWAAGIIVVFLYLKPSVIRTVVGVFVSQAAQALPANSGK
jgi:hypothetical protein